METLVLALRRFSVDTIVLQKLTPPVQIELFDVGMTRFFAMEANHDPEGTFIFSSERFLSGSLFRRGPYTLRFTSAGKEEFVTEFPSLNLGW